MTASEISLFAQILRPDQIVSKENVPERYQTDWTYENAVCPTCLLLPETTEEVSQILSVCHENRQPIVIQGGVSGLTGAATPQVGEISLSLERMVGIEHIDEIGLSMRVLAGTTLADIHRALAGTQCIYGVDYGARDIAQIGGNASTNAGGTQVIRYGMTRAQVLGLEVVLADGTIVNSMNTLLKNNAGFDLKQLFIGSEGTLGVITKLQLRLHPKPSSCCTALFAIDSYDNCLMLLKLCRGLFSEALTGFEVMWKAYFDDACEASGSAPFETDENDVLYALVEVRGQSQEHDWTRFSELFRQCQQEGILKTGALAESKEDASTLWDIRFAIKQLLQKKAKMAHFDIGISPSEIQKFVTAVENELTQLSPKITIYAFGHIADGNIHLLINTDQTKHIGHIENMVYSLCDDFGGTISAEHGIGVLKKEALLRNRSTEEIELMRKLKRSLDPNNILNSGRVFDLD